MAMLNNQRVNFIDHVCRLSSCCVRPSARPCASFICPVNTLGGMALLQNCRGSVEVGTLFEPLGGSMDIQSINKWGINGINHESLENQGRVGKIM